MAKKLHVRRLGLMPYREAFALQEALVAAHHAGEGVDTLLLLEHPPVITLGRDAKRDNVKHPEAFLNERGIELVDTDRGGDATFHGPGQLVAYPMIRLEGAARDLHAHLHRLEDLMIGVCADLGLSVGRDPRNTGVWSEGRKVGSIGIACRRWVTWHGCALNVDPDLSAFARIHPCGFDAGIMTSVSRGLGRPVSLGAAEEALVARVVGW